MITAEEFWDSSCKNEKLKSPADIMNEWAKYHVEKALNFAADNAETVEESGVDSDGQVYEYRIIDKQSILKAYNLNNIK